MKHVQSVHEKITPYQCHLCAYSATEKGHLSYHISAIHDGEKPFKCDICGKGFPVNSHLKVHNRQVHGDKIKKILGI